MKEARKNTPDRHPLRMPLTCAALLVSAVSFGATKGPSAAPVAAAAAAAPAGKAAKADPDVKDTLNKQV